LYVESQDHGSGIRILSSRHTKALAYVPSTPKSATGGFTSAAAGAAYPLKAVLGTVLLAAATIGRASREDIIPRIISSTDCSTGVRVDVGECSQEALRICWVVVPSSKRQLAVPTSQSRDAKSTFS
jgi:hypothetical protein